MSKKLVWGQQNIFLWVGIGNTETPASERTVWLDPRRRVQYIHTDSHPLNKPRKMIQLQFYTKEALWNVESTLSPRILVIETLRPFTGVFHRLPGWVPAAHLHRWYVYPTWAYVVGWLTALSSIALLPGWALMKLATTPGTLRQVKGAEPNTDHTN